MVELMGCTVVVSTKCRIVENVKQTFFTDFIVVSYLGVIL